MLLLGCRKDVTEPESIEDIKIEQLTSLPFEEIQLNDLLAFKPASNNWKIVGNTYIERNRERTIKSDNGTGVLLNIPNDTAKDNLFFNFEHGDIELELDVMMPVKSNSGLYFQGRYEVQLFDSWDEKDPKFSDMGGIYQRWDKTKEKGSEGYEGHAPLLNASKAPGLWQHFKIIFHAPTFDETGVKTKNAWFEEVWLNGSLIQKNIEITGPTRAAAFDDEKPLGPLMIQGDHGPVAFKNIKYKIYKDHKIGIENTTLKIYDNSQKAEVISSLDSLSLLETRETDSISPLMEIDSRDQKVLSYNGFLKIPVSGDYLFETRVNGGAYLIIDKDTISNMNFDSNLDSITYNKVHLKEGSIAFQLTYNKPAVWRQGFDLFVEGPNIQRYSMLNTTTSELISQNPIEPILLNVSNKIITQRCFMTHRDTKRTHCIAVGLTEKLNYSLDLETGSLLHVWDGDFLDVTQMWHARGEQQVGKPLGFSVSSHGNLDFASLEDKKSYWPKISDKDLAFKPLGYEIKDNGLPVFLSEINGAKVSQSFITDTNSKRGLVRRISAQSDKSLWHKIAEGETILALPNNTYIVNNESYYIVFPDKSIKPIIRTIKGKDELVLEIPKGKVNINYSIIW